MNAAGIRYHYVITLQFSLGTGRTATSYGEGTITPGDGQTRQQVFRQVREITTGQAPYGPEIKPVVVFFSLEPDELQQEGEMTK